MNVLNNLKFLMVLSHDGPVMTQHLWRQQGLIDVCTVQWFENWPSEGFKEVAKARLNYTPKTWEELIKFDPNPDQTEGLANIKRDASGDSRDALIDLATRWHADMKSEVAEYIEETGQKVFISPQSFINLLRTFNHVHALQSDKYEHLATRMRKGLECIKDTEIRVN